MSPQRRAPRRKKKIGRRRFLAGRGWAVPPERIFCTVLSGT